VKGAAVGRSAALRVLQAAFGASLALVAHAAPSLAADAVPRPQDLVRTSVTRVQDAVRSNIGRTSDAQRAEIREVAEKLFDFESMSRRMLARYWNNGTTDQQAEFVRLLTNLLARTYIEAIANGARGRMTVDGEFIDGAYAQVRTRMGGDVGPEVSIDYRLFGSDGRWAVYDVVHEGVSLVANYRDQLASILRSSSVPALLERMRDNERHAGGRAETAEAIGRRLLLFSVMAEKGAR
jgi:phospholipid transport system substrate-binding protein